MSNSEKNLSHIEPTRSNKHYVLTFKHFNKLKKQPLDSVKNQPPSTILERYGSEKLKMKTELFIQSRGAKPQYPLPRYPLLISNMA